MTSKTILVTGATDGIGLETARKLKSMGHEVIVHGRSQNKLEAVANELGAKSYIADLSDLKNVKDMADSILKDYSSRS